VALLSLVFLFEICKEVLLIYVISCVCASVIFFIYLCAPLICIYCIHISLGRGVCCCRKISVMSEIRGCMSRRLMSFTCK
jgi:hypothetical protein